MARIDRSEIMDKLKEGLRLNPALDKIPNELASKIVPVFEVSEKKILKSVNASSADSASTLLHATRIGVRTFIKSLNLQVSKDVVSDSTFSFITGIPKSQSAAKTLIYVRHEPLTAASNLSNYQEYDFDGFELQPNTSILFGTNSATASIDISAVMVYYEIEE